MTEPQDYWCEYCEVYVRLFDNEEYCPYCGAQIDKSYVPTFTEYQDSNSEDGEQMLNNKIELAKKKPPCVHGNLCKAYWDKFKIIYSSFCPICEFYKPKIKDGEQIWILVYLAQSYY